MDDLRIKLESRLRELQQARDTYISQAQRQIGGFDGAISELQRLLEELGPPDAEDADDAG